MLLKERLKLARKTLNLTQKQLAVVAGLTDTAIKQIEAGRTATVSYDYAKTWENQFGISEQWLRFEKGTMFNHKESFELDDRLITLPCFENIKALKGSECINYEHSNNYMKIPKAFLSNLPNTKNLEVIKVSDDSMQNTFFSDDLIIMDKEKVELQNNKIFVVLYENEIFVKRIFILPKNKTLLNSDNTFYPSIEVKQNEEFKIIGQVVISINVKNL